MEFPTTRMRRLRKNAKIRDIVRETKLEKEDLIYPIYFKEDLKVTIQALGWRSGGRFRPLQDDISSVAYWYSDNLNDVYPQFPTLDELELI